jgi:hypothetical protein
MPTASDLVTDLPADFETFGQAVATSMADLLGGTTGQVLSKASNTDMDFTWVTSDDANAIQNTIVDAKGDLIAATAADTPARLAVGTNGQVLTADSTAATGLAWATASGGSTNVAGKNGCLNSNFSIWQRGTTNVTTAQAYTADRWQKGGATHFGVSRQVTGDTTNLPNIQYCARVQRTASSAVTSNMDINQSFETINSIPFVGKTVTFSFYARAGANYSATSNLLNGTIYTGTGTDQNLIATYTGAATPISVNATLTTTWQRFSGSGTISSSATELAIYIQGTPTGTAGANDYYEVTGVQLEIAGSASAYSPNSATQQAELSACQRYYSTSIPTGYTVTDFPIMGTSGAGGQIFWATGTSDLFGSLQYPVPLRSTPTFTAYSGNNRTAGNARDMTTGSDIVFTPSPQTGNNRLLSYVTVASTATSGRPYGFQWTASAEL